MEYGLKHQTSRTVLNGKPYPLGATLRDGGVNFAVYSQSAAEVFLLLFDYASGAPSDIIRLQNRTKFVWHTFVSGVTAGQLYDYKMRGDYNPARGLRFNEHKLLLDPYAKAFTGKCLNSNLLLAYDPLSTTGDLSVDTRDNTALLPKSIVVDDRFDWQGASVERIRNANSPR